MGDLSAAIEVRDPPTWRDLAARSGWAAAARARISTLDAETDPARRAWLLWREAKQCKEIGMLDLARGALDAADTVVSENEWTPVWAAEMSLLRLSLLQDDGEEGQALGWVSRAALTWRQIGDWLFSEPDPDDVAAVLRGAQQMCAALIGSERLGVVASQSDLALAQMSLAIWLTDRWTPAFDEVCARASALIGLASYEQAKTFLGDTMVHVHRWASAGQANGILDVALIEAGIQLQLSACAGQAGRWSEGIAHSDAGLRILGESRPGRSRREKEARLRGNKAHDLIALGELTEAVSEYGRAEAAFAELGLTAAAIHCRHGALATTFLAGDPVDPDDVRDLISQYEAVIDGATLPDGTAMSDVEQARRMLLSAIAVSGDVADAEEAMSLLEVLRNDRPVLRGGASWPDPVVSRLCGPLGIVAARLAKLPDTVILVHEAGMNGPVFLILGGGARSAPRLVGATRETEAALSRLAEAAQAERERLIATEVPLQSDASPGLAEAAEAAWAEFPASVRDAIDGASTILYMPSALGSPARAHLELLKAGDEWLGTTRVIVRCPSLVYLTAMVAPNRVAWPPPESAWVIEALPSEELGALSAATADAETAVRGATVLGLMGERRQISNADDAVDVLTSGRLVHYVGHGLASDVGEVLPLSPQLGLSPAALDQGGRSPAPFVFFSACSLAYTRHLAGGRQRGWALAMLDRGAPAVLGSLFAVPDELCPMMTESFYRGAWKSPVGEGLRRARAELHAAGINPAAWSTFVLLGDPNAVISARLADAPPDTPAIVARWPSYLTRFFSTGDQRYGDRFSEAVANDPLLSDAPAAKSILNGWPEGSATIAAGALAAAVDDLREFDLEGAAVLRILLALRRADDGTASSDELATAWLAADALDDNYASLLVAAKYAAHWDGGRPESDRVALAEAARACLEQLPVDAAALGPLAELAVGG